MYMAMPLAEPNGCAGHHLPMLGKPGQKASKHWRICRKSLQGFVEATEVTPGPRHGLQLDKTLMALL